MLYRLCVISIYVIYIILYSYLLLILCNNKNNFMQINILNRKKFFDYNNYTKEY